MKAKLIGLLMLFLTISIVENKVLYVQFKLKPVKTIVDNCEDFVNSILIMAYTDYKKGTCFTGVDGTFAKKVTHLIVVMAILIMIKSV